MVRTPASRSSNARHGVILLVVLALLTLFAIVGIGFVLYANATATAARIYRQAHSQSQVDVDPELLLSFFMGQLVFDVPDDARGVYSGLRGHSLARSMFGLNYNLAPDGTLRLASNDVPFNGTGRLHFPSPFAGQDDFSLINYTYFPADNFLRDPERYGPRSGLPVKGAADNRQPFVGGFNAPYTYPDLNNLFLAAVKAGSIDLPGGGKSPPGVVLMPSFHRPWLFGPLTEIPNSGQQNPGNPNWTNREGKYLLLRPRPIDMGPGFPYPEDEGGDVKNLVGGPGYYDPFTQRLHNNDSVWIDLDFPVMTAPDGRKFKPLFAPLVVDLDNRINLNVAGNLRGLNQTKHASNSGWGPWEVNPARVLDQASNEWLALLRGNASTAGRYGRDSWPHSPLPNDLAAWNQKPPFYAPIDLDGSNELAAGQPSAAIALPGTKPSLPYQCFPTPGAGYGNANRLERLNHPLLFNPFHPTAPDRIFALSNMEALLRYGDTGSPALTSDLYRLCPLNFGDPADPEGAGRRRGLVTLGSFDPDRPGVGPWFWPAGAAGYEGLKPEAIQPSGGPVPFPPLGGLPPIHPDSEFGPDWRTVSALTSLRRLDLNRYLPDYPKPDPSGIITDILGFQVAQTARQHLAGEIFDRLWKTTGLGSPDTVPKPVPKVGLHAERWAAFRWVAQLAVNIVDFIDNDDCITPFNWYPPYPGNPAGEWVFGTELPCLVLNEDYVQYDNDPNDRGIKKNKQATRYNVNIWVELHNPMSAQATLSDGGAAVLQTPKFPIYQVVVSRGEPNLRAPTNVLGNPVNVITAVTSWGPDPNTWVVLPSNGEYHGRPGGNQGFYVLGPQVEVPPKANTNLPATLLSPEMTFQVKVNQVSIKPTLLLRRLACPHLPPNPNPRPGEGETPFNPYVTVDYMEDIPFNDGRLFDETGPHVPPPMIERYAAGRKQPYAGHPGFRTRQWPNPRQLDQPQNTFFQHNTDIDTPGPNRGSPPPDYPPFDWLVHLDRPLISPMELLHVSAFRPHELTHQFNTGDAPDQHFNHRARWFDEDLAGSNPPRSHRLYRALEFLGTRNQMLGMMTASTTSLVPLPGAGPDQAVVPRALFGRTASGGTWHMEVGDSLVIDRGLPSEEVVRIKTLLPGGTPPQFTADFLKPHRANFTIAPTTISERLPGKVNLNTVWDEEIFQALCDAQPSNSFNNPEIVSAIFNQLKASRTVGAKGGPETPSALDRPFRSLATGFTPYDDTQFPDGGLSDTLLRPIISSISTDRQPILAVPGMTHPYQTYELMTKIFNNVTVRSNVFAVWVTVGFFEVTDDTTRPVKLGAEVGRAEGRHIRHRMFAMVDRSHLVANPGPQPEFSPRQGPIVPVATGLVVPYVSIID
jgi:hypothetical protein